MIFIMARSFKEAIQHRRTHYGIGNNSPISDNEIHEIIKTAVTHVPSAFNSQSTRIVLLLGESHKKLWEIVKDTLRKIVPDEAYKATEAKIDNSFEAGYGTVLFFEDTAVVEGLQKQFPSYKDNFPVWSQQTSAMHQLAIWTMLEDAGFGASLQHYNPLIDELETDRRDAVRYLYARTGRKTIRPIRGTNFSIQIIIINVYGI